MTATCQCGRPVDGAFLCQQDTTKLRGTLEYAAWIAGELDVTLARQARFGERNGGKSADKPLPYDVRASEAAWVLRNTLTTWCRVMIDELGQDMPKTATPGESDGLTGAPRYGRANQDVTTAEAALWLSQRIGVLRTHPAAGEAADEIGQAVAQARRAIDQPANRARIPIGPCPEPQCPGHLTAYIPAQPDRHPTITCGQGHTWDTIHWRSIGRRVLAARAST